MQSDCEVKESNEVQFGCTFKKGCMSEKSLEAKFREHVHNLLEAMPMSNTQYDSMENGFYAGYELAKKELEEQIKRKEEQIKEVEKIAESLSSLTPYGDKRFELYSRKYYSRA